ncbi:MAG: hypothetical protein HQK58_16040 [Deltaproteobacteria bacterium]|nr:hypothetical protein [Deltaproteobacteria bacterium]
MFKIIPVVMMLVWTAFSGLTAWSATAPGPPDAPGSQFNSRGEKIGELRLNLPEKAVIRNIPCRPKKSKEIFEAATGEYVQMWKYAECGIVLKMSSDHKGGAKAVASIIVSGPCKLVTSRGIHIGSTESEVIRAYGRYGDQEGNTVKGKRFVAGSIYDGMVFDFKGGRVVGIFLGAGAE